MPLTSNGVVSTAALTVAWTLGLAFSIAITGCVAVDSRASHEPIDVVATRALHGQFNCYPYYRSHSIGFVGPPNIPSILGGYQCGTVTLDVDPGHSLKVSYQGSDATSASRIFTAASGLSMTKEGQYMLSRNTECGGGMAVGCSKQTFLLWLNPEGDLVCVQTGGGGGLFLVVPVGVYGKMMAIFSRIRD